MEQNKLEKVVTNPYTKKEKIQIQYFPMVLYNSVERDFSYVFSGGKWNKITNETNATEKMTLFEPAINLILTN